MVPPDDSDSPAGSTPTLIDQLYGGVPPLAVRTTGLYAMVASPTCTGTPVITRGDGPGGAGGAGGGGAGGAGGGGRIGPDGGVTTTTGTSAIGGALASGVGM